MPLYNFQQRFADAVESGAKTQTIRRLRKRPTRAGEMLHLYTGLRSKNTRLLRRAKCVKVLPIEIHPTHIIVDGVILTPDETRKFAIADGFSGRADFYDFWRDVHGLTKEKPLKGFELIQWEALHD